MASSQVEIASSSPFACVLRDSNQHNGYRTRESKAFQKNLNDLVQNQLSSCRNAGSGSLANENSHPCLDFADLWVHHPQASNDNSHHSREPGHTRISDQSNSNENSHQHIDYADLWVHNPQRNNDANNQNSGGKCGRARDTVIAAERKSENGVSSGPLANPPRARRQDGAKSQPVSRVRSPESSRPVSSSQRRRSLEGASSRSASTSQKRKNQDGMSSSPVSTSQTDSSVEVPNSGAVSSLVQKWRNFEGKSSAACCRSKCNSGMCFVDDTSFEGPNKSPGACDESVDIRPDTPTISEESNGDWESVRTGFSTSPGRDFDAAEKERIRVADIIKKLSSNSEEHIDREHAVLHESLPRVRTSVDQSEPPISCSPRIRGRQAFCDFQMQMERERNKELEGLLGYKAVSKFSHRGRIHAMLRVRFLHRGAELKDGRHRNCTSSNSNGPKQSAIVHLREMYSSRAKHSASDLRSSSQGEVAVCNTEIENFSISCQQRKENPQKKLTGTINTLTVDSDTSAAAAEGSFRSNSVERGTNNNESNNMVEQSAFQVQSSERKESRPPELPQLENPPMLAAKGSADSESSSGFLPLQGNINHLESSCTVQNSNFQVQNSENLYQEANDLRQCSSSHSCNHGKSELPVVTGTSFQCSEGNLYTELQETNNQQMAGNGNGLINEIRDAQGYWEEEKDNNHHLDCSWESDVFHQPNGLEELQSDYQKEVEINHDWINDVSRPRRTWEDLRQARYQEMLDPFLENDEIRRLLERKSVSSFLSGGMRERIDRLMMSRTQQISRSNQLEGESEQERMKEEKVKEHEGGGEGDEYELNNEEEEEEDSIDYNDYYEDLEHEIQGGRHNAAKSYISQTTSWVHVQDHEVSDNYSDQAASPYVEQSPLSNLSTLDSQRSMNSHSIEMELIYELKGNMEQLHQEISELRRSIKCCVNMQMELQQSIKREITAALCQSAKQKKREKRNSSRGRCCICYEVPIDSLLYRCGHMCTCFNCAHELQWGSGKCPVCQAPIIDVVRTYAHS